MSGSGGSSRGPKAPNFLQRTFEMLSKPELAEYVSWNADGTSIIVHKVNKFSTVVLPRFYNHSNYASFTRQLNMYDFKKTSSEPSCREYKHPLFQRDRPELVAQIKRKKRLRSSDGDSADGGGAGGAGAGADATALVTTGTDGHGHLSTVLNEMATLKTRQKQVENSVVALGNHNRLLAKENEMLWQQLSDSRTRQQRLSNKMQRLFYVMYEIYRAMVGQGRGAVRVSGDALPALMGMEAADGDSPIGAAGVGGARAAAAAPGTAAEGGAAAGSAGAGAGAGGAHDTRQLAHRTYSSLFGSDSVLTPEQFNRALDVFTINDGKAPTPPATGGVVVSELHGDTPTEVGSAADALLSVSMAEVIASQAAAAAAGAAAGSAYGFGSSAGGTRTAPTAATVTSAAVDNGGVGRGGGGSDGGRPKRRRVGSGDGVAAKGAASWSPPRPPLAVRPPPSPLSLEVDDVLKTKDPVAHVTAAHSELEEHASKLDETIDDLEDRIKSSHDFDVDDLLDPSILEGLASPNPAAAAAAAAAIAAAAGSVSGGGAGAGAGGGLSTPFPTVEDALGNDSMLLTPRATPLSEP
mmetsp:Transcript_4196/g.15472  ORF Transcript_4196/g.15472 Transcript_4196/m.15472 type:complete len:579 (-) Transcript_4196:88-1824(-)|eukprot:CAMPEP_0203819340 /NCGR_PEP_ID=MMETSP0115-20131106/35245_1 /ASSEMBLY_ACC=CAM_ASM_000227 /TAXON_ID=33651 /ORGANISM="Bicosoecid sp, Strain ms1" /LENGTH=578 /DNA_ID=CAMNT_0050728319 /DNA_START=252 /DNA_END=1988 /DNA_ORIENTATION=-